MKLIKGNIEGTSVCYYIDQETWTDVNDLFKSFLGQKINRAGDCC